MGDDNNTTNALISVAEALLNAFIALILVASLLGLLALMLGIGDIDGLRKFMSDSSDIMIALLKIVAVLLVFALLLMLGRWLSKEEKGVRILPFEVAIGESEYSGKAISHLLVAELERIQRIHGYVLPLIKRMNTTLGPRITYVGGPILAKELSDATTTNDALQDLEGPDKLRLRPQSDDLTYNELGAISVGMTSIPLGSLLIVLKNLWPLGDTAPVITGSLQKYGSKISLVACQEHHVIRSWEANDWVGSENIPDLVRDISIKIFRDINNEFAITWLALKYFIESLEYYRQYRITDDTVKLKRASTSFLKAKKADPKCAMLDDLGNILGFSWYSEGNNRFDMGKLKEAQNCYEKALKFGISVSSNMKKAIHDELIKYYSNLNRLNGYTLILMGESEEARKYYDDALRLNPENVYAWNEKGTVCRILGSDENAITCYMESIKFAPSFTIAYVSLAAIYRKLGREVESAKQCTIARDLIENENEYNRACFEAVCGSAERALDLLRSALEKEQATPEWARRDPDFEFVRDDPRFQELLREFSGDEESGSG